MASAQISHGGHNWGCATAGFASILSLDTSATVEAGGRRWAALMGLQGMQLSQGKPDSAEALISSYIARWRGGTSVFLLDATALGVLSQRADTVAAADAREFGHDFRRCVVQYRCWILGLHLTRAGRLDEAEALAEHLLKPGGAPPPVDDSLLPRSLRAHVALARGDTNAAVVRFTELLSSARRESAMAWDEALSMAAERLALARILHARGQHRRAIAVLDVFDSRSIVHPLYLATSLDLRAKAADALGDGTLATAYRARLAALRQK